MSNHKRILLLLILMCSVYAMSYEPVEALPFDNEYVNQWITANDYSYMDISLVNGDVVTGYIETDDTSMLLDFFICDYANLLIFDGGGNPTTYLSLDDVHSYAFTYTITSTMTWYFVFSNVDSSGVYVDVAIDVNGDNRPYYSGYDTELNDQLLENDEWYYVWYELGAGSEISGHFSTYFTTDGVDFFICDEYNYDEWADGYTADVYGSIDDYHVASIADFTVPHDDTWYMVFSATGQTDAVTLSFGIDVVIVQPSFNVSGILGILGTLAVVGIVCFCCCRKKQDQRPQLQPVRGGFTPPPRGFGDARSSDDIVLGALKSYPRISMNELADILKIPVDQVRRTTLKLIGTEAVSGTFDRRSDEFTSIDASEAGRELREDAMDAFALPRCPNCSAPLSKPLVAGETMECPNCGTWVTG
ncbi:MAG: hypothetical protein ACTSUO_00995 [Candidatus Thorarchaeota archaeon]